MQTCRLRQYDGKSASWKHCNGRTDPLVRTRFAERFKFATTSRCKQPIKNSDSSRCAASHCASPRHVSADRSEPSHDRPTVDKLLDHSQSVGRLSILSRDTRARSTNTFLSGGCASLAPIPWRRENLRRQKPPHETILMIVLSIVSEKNETQPLVRPKAHR